MNDKTKSNDKAGDGSPLTETACSVFDRWPLGVNKSMDDHAAGMGLPHWSCVSPKSNKWWVRSDGHQCEPFYRTIPSMRGYVDVLKEYDEDHPISQNSH